MNDIDEKIRKALNAEDQKILDAYGEDLGPLDMVALSFKGIQSWYMGLIWLMGFISFGVIIYCTVNYMNTDDLKESLSWAVGILLAGITLATIKLASWQHMQNQAMVREIKRLELRWMNSLDMNKSTKKDSNE